MKNIEKKIFELVKEYSKVKFKKKNSDYKIRSTLENTDMIMTNSFWIGVYPGLGEDELSYSVKKIKEFVSKNR